MGAVTHVREPLEKQTPHKEPKAPAEEEPRAVTHARGLRTQSCAPGGRGSAVTHVRGSLNQQTNPSAPEQPPSESGRRAP